MNNGKLITFRRQKVACVMCGKVMEEATPDCFYFTMKSYCGSKRHTFPLCCESCFDRVQIIVDKVGWIHGSSMEYMDDS